MLTRNTHFTIGAHVLTGLAMHDPEPVPSETLAASVGTNAAFLRTVIGELRAAGLVRSKLGKGGGSYLARRPEDITLLDVYRATVGETGLNMHPCDPDSPCSVAATMHAFIDSVSRKLDAAIAEELTTMSIADIVALVGARCAGPDNAMRGPLTEPS